MVGDVKQSIYRFRQARPELFLEKYESYTDDLDSNSPEKKILLFKNFRSNINIIDQANFIFKNIMSKAVGEIDYTETEYLKFGATYYLNEGTEAEINLIEKSSKEELEENIEDDIEDKPQLEGRVIAKRISELVNNFDIYDKHTGKMRKAKYSDIVILLRATKGYANCFVEELAKMNIPAFADINTGYFENTEVQIILSLLKIIDNPYQDIPLIAVMRSQIGNFTPDELTEIRLIDKNTSYYEALQKSAGQGNDKVKAFIEKLDEWRERSKHINLDELIWSLYEETGYYNYISLLPDGAIRTANLKTLLDKATMYDKTSYRGLFNFITFLDNIKDSSGDLGSSKEIGENDNVVRIMSIHKSKGLEFPIVFLSGTSRKFNMRDMSNPIILHQDYGFGADVIDNDKRIYYSSVPKLALKLKSKKESMSEEMRILYVALTRAREKLIVTAMETDIGKKLDKWCKKNTQYAISSSNNFAEWICRTVISNNANWKINEWSYNDVLKLSKIEEGETNYIYTLLQNIDKNLEFTDEYKFIDSRLKFKYKYAYSTKIPNKVSVTELKRLNEYDDIGTDLMSSQEINDMIEKPDFMNDRENKIIGTAYGTLVHNLMQRLDFENPNIEKIIDSVDADEKTKQSLKRELENFLKSNLYEEVKRAKGIYKEAPFNLEVRAEDVYEIEDESKNDILMIQGIIDMYFENEEGIVLVDYKTDRVDSELELIKRYKKQLDYYEEALAKLTNKKIVGKYIYSFSLKKAIEI